MHALNTLLATYRPGQLPEPGIYEGIARDDYFSWPCLNNSLLKHATRTLAHFRHAMETPTEPTDAMRFGTLAHSGILEPLQLANQYAVMPDLTEGITTANGQPAASPKATKQYKQRVAEWEAANSTKEIVEQEWLDDVIAMHAQLLRNDRAMRYLAPRGPVECAIVWDDPSGVRCKALCDKIDNYSCRIADYKTTRDLRRFDRAIIDFSYDMQGAFYLDGISAIQSGKWQFAIVAQESSAPFLLQADVLPKEQITEGRRIYREALEKVAHAAEVDHWPGYGDPDWSRPHWATKDEQSVGDWLRENQEEPPE